MVYNKRVSVKGPGEYKSYEVTLVTKDDTEYGIQQIAIIDKEGNKEEYNLDSGVSPVLEIDDSTTPDGFGKILKNFITVAKGEKPGNETLSSVKETDIDSDDDDDFIGDDSSGYITPTITKPIDTVSEDETVSGVNPMKNNVPPPAEKAEPKTENKAEHKVTTVTGQATLGGKNTRFSKKKVPTKKRSSFKNKRSKK